MEIASKFFDKKSCQPDYKGSDNGELTTFSQDWLWKPNLQLFRAQFVELFTYYVSERDVENHSL